MPSQSRNGGQLFSGNVVSKTVGGSKDSRRSAVPKSLSRDGRVSVGVLEKVVLPAGYCLYYAPGADAPLVQWEPVTSRASRASLKGLGSVDPVVLNTHCVVQEEYAVIREVVEVIVEREATGEGQVYRVGGQLEEQRQWLDRLAQSLPVLPDIQTETGGSEDSGGSDGSPVVKDSSGSDGSLVVKSSPPVKLSRRSLLPISKALQAGVSPRVTLLIRGQAVKDAEGSTARSKDSGGVPVMAGSRPGQWAGRGGCLFTVHRKPLVSRKEQARKKDKTKVERGFPFIRTVHQRYPDLADGHVKGTAPRGHGARLKAPASPRANRPLVASPGRERANVQGRRAGGQGQRPSRAEAGLTPRSEAGGEGVPVTGKRPSPTFQLTSKRRGGAAKQWLPRVSRRGLDPQPDPGRRDAGLDPGSDLDSSSGPPQVEGQSFVTKTSSRVILNVVLPREDASREDRLCLRHLVAGWSHPHDDQGLGQQPMMKPPRSPPPPPPNSAPTHDCDDDNDVTDPRHYYHHDVLNIHDDGDGLVRQGPSSYGRPEQCPGSRADPAPPATQGRSAGTPATGPPGQGDAQCWATEESLGHLGLSELTSGQGLSATKATAVAKAATTHNDPRVMSASRSRSMDYDGIVLKARPVSGSRPKSRVPLTDLRLSGQSARRRQGVMTSAPPHRQQTEESGPVDQRLQHQQQCQDHQHHQHHQHQQQCQDHQHHQHHQHHQQCQDHQPPSAAQPHSPSTSARAAHCDLLGPHLCADCEAADFRRQFTAQQDALYPGIDVHPRHMVASTRIHLNRNVGAARGDYRGRAGWSKAGNSPRWPFLAVGQLNDVLTDLDVCNRVAEKGLRTRLSTHFS